MDLLPQKTLGGICFKFKGAADIASVAVAGTFNCWRSDSAKLERIDATTWQCTLPIATGRHLYKYVIDGQRWIRDPANAWISEDGQHNSCFTVDEFGDVFIRADNISKTNPACLYERHQALPSPDWLSDGVIYQLSIRAFGGDFNGVKARLAYLADLGANIIWIMPIHPVGIARRIGVLGDPYAVQNFDVIDAQLGSDDDFRALVDAAHLLSMRVMLDWTLNRSSCDNRLTETHPDWFTRDAEGKIFYAVPNRDYFAGFDFSKRELRAYLIHTMQYWLQRFHLDGFRFDDSDLTPLDFLVEIRTALQQVQPHIALISQAYDEFHHIAACDLTYEGGTRQMLRQLADGDINEDAFHQSWNAATYSFPKQALRMRWLEEKETERARHFYGADLHLAAATVILTLDGVPHLLMGQEFNELRWKNWTSLFNDFQLDWSAFDETSFRHYRALIALRQRHQALRQGETRFVQTGIPKCLSYWRCTADERILITVNLSDQAINLQPQAESMEVIYRAGLHLDTQVNQHLAAFDSIILRAA